MSMSDDKIANTLLERSQKEDKTTPVNHTGVVFLHKVNIF